MYILNEFNYDNKSNKVVFAGSLYNALNVLEEKAHNYILNKQGTNINIDYNDLVYNYNDSPNRQRSLTCGGFYVKKSKSDPNKITVKQKKKIYGYLYNSYDYINHIGYSLTESEHKIEYREYREYRVNFTEYDKYEDVINSINLFCNMLFEELSKKHSMDIKDLDLNKYIIGPTSIYLIKEINKLLEKKLRTQSEDLSYTTTNLFQEYDTDEHDVFIPRSE